MQSSGGVETTIQALKQLLAYLHLKVTVEDFHKKTKLFVYSKKKKF